MCDIAELYLADLSTYRVTADETAGLRRVCADFLVKMPQPRESKRDAKQITRELKALLKLTNNSLLEMDAIMLIVRYSESGFYDHYLNSRKVVYTGTRHLSLNGKATHALTGNGLTGVNITIESANGSAVKNAAGTDLLKNVRITTAKGGFRMKSLESGTYLITATKEGFASQTITVFINTGEITTVLFVMQPL